MELRVAETTVKPRPNCVSPANLTYLVATVGTVHFTSSDVAAGLPADYTFTAGDAGVHTFVSGVTLMTAGTHEVRVLDKAQSSITGAQSGILVTTTATPPTASITAQPLWLAANTVTVRWNATAGTFPLDTYDVLYRRAAWNADFGSLVTWRSATTATSGTLAASPGYTYCFSARARDTNGGVSPLTTETCTAIPLGDRSLARSANWTAGTGAAYYRATYLSSTKVGAKLLRTGVVAKRIAIVATTGPGRGSVGVYWGSTLLKTINLASAATVNKKLILVATFPSVKTGTLTIKVLSSGKPVTIDGVAIRRF